MNQIIVSVIVTTKNEEKNITNCLRSINNSMNSMDSTNPHVEIIVVDNNSSDNTIKIAKEFTDKVYNKGPERSAQRNFGVEKARGKYILYLDADMILSKKVIEECVNKCEKEGCVASHIPERIIGKGFWIKVRDFERSFYNATCIDAVRFVKKDKLLKIGGFDENFFVAEDWDFDRRIRKTGKVDIIDAPLYHNEGRFNLKKYLEKKAYYSGNFDSYIKKWGRNDLLIKKQMGLWYRLFGVFIENAKWKRLMRHPQLTIRLYSLRFIVGIMYLKGGEKKSRGKGDYQ